MQQPPTTCQLYKYNPSFYLVKKESAAYFATEFLDGELDGDYVSWLNYHDINDKESIENLCLRLGIDRLSIENIYKEIRRPKVEEYSKYIFFSVISALPSKKNEELLFQEQITFFLSSDYLLSLQKRSGDHFNDVRDRIEKGRGKIRSKKADFLLFRNLEAIIDNYFEVIDEITQTVGILEKELHVSEDKSILNKIEREKRKLIELRKIANPMRDITIQLQSSDSIFIDKTNVRYFIGLHHSCMHVIEEIESLKQVLDGMSNFYYASQGQRMNEIMKVLTIVSSIFIPLTFIAGVYGMNFENMPELKYKNGYYTIIGIMIALGISLFSFFVYRGWLKRRDYIKEN
jgi:magnesium transporter